MFSAFDRIYYFSINSIVFFTAIIITVLFWLGATYLFSDIAIYIPITIIGSLIGVFIGAYLHVILSIPFKLSKSFDVIKDKVALQEYVSVDNFQKDIAEFIVKIFNFSGADICGGYFNFNQASPLKFNVDIDDSLLTGLNEKKCIKKLNGNKAFYIPVKIGEKNLGYMILFAEGFTLPFLHSVLLDFENYMLDDQLLHVQNYCKKN